ncbi:MAG: type II toxin-antitoxin system RelE/ParE family toxin [Nitrospirae bacterium]|nr:type II toxin-antitoxin system RelE/ParE family toxin [Nitrospirota bacterium]
MYDFWITKYFKKQLKKASKKDKSLLEELRKSLKNFTTKGAISIASNIYKIRLRKKGQGKSGGYRIYILIVELGKIITPICIYSKSNKESITQEELALHLEMVRKEIEI